HAHVPARLLSLAVAGYGTPRGGTGPPPVRSSVAPVVDADAHLERIRAQFGKQADVYARMRQATDEGALNALVEVSRADAGSRVLDVACGPGFLTMSFAARCRH